MKKVILLILITTLFLVSCNKGETEKKKVIKNINEIQEFIPNKSLGEF